MEEPAQNPDPRRAGSPASVEGLKAFNWNAGLRSFYDTICGAGLFIFVSFALSLGLAKERIGADHLGRRASRACCKS